MRWRADFYAYYRGKEGSVLARQDGSPVHWFDPCLPPDEFYEHLYKGPGGYKKVFDQENRRCRLVIFEAKSGEWHLFGVRGEEDCDTREDREEPDSGAGATNPTT